MKAVAYTIGCLACVVSVFFLAVGNNGSTAPVDEPRPAPRDSNKSQGHTAAPVSETLPCTSRNNSHFAVSPENTKRTMIDSGVGGEKLAMAYTHPEKALAAAQHGDGAAAVGLYTMLASCRSGLIYRMDKRRPMNEACPRFELPDSRRPLEIVQQAAEAGSHETKLLFMTNAAAIAPYLAKKTSNEDVAFAARLTKQAEAYGKEMAALGYPDAFRFMSRAYLIGTFGARDYERAYLYALPLAVVGNPGEGGGLHKIGRLLTASQRSRLEAQVWGCKPAPDSVPINSPFGR
jgi:hypothetical protein